MDANILFEEEPEMQTKNQPESFASIKVVGVGGGRL